MRHPVKARLLVGLIMLGLAFLGMILTDVRSEGGWDYWKWAVPIYAVLALWLSWYVRRDLQVMGPITLWHEALHWAGVVAAVFLVSFFVHLGTISRFNAGLFDLTLLGLGVFLAGIYIETSFLGIGVILGLLAMVSAATVQYLYALILPLLIAGALILAISLWLSHKQKT